METSRDVTGVGRFGPADAEAIAATLRALTARVESLAAIVEALAPIARLAPQAPALAATLGDSFDDVMRTAIERGIDVERGILNGLEAALRFGAIMDAAKVRDLEALLQSGVLDPEALRVIGEMGRALVDTAEAKPAGIGPIGLLTALGNPDVRRALGFLIAFAERFGSALGKPRQARA